MKENLLASTLGLALTLTGTASANIIMTGDYVLTQVSNDGTLGNRGFNPGLVYDSTGLGNFDSNFDYLAPGTPHEAFGIRYNTVTGSSGLLGNSNSASGDVTSGDDFSLVSLTDMTPGSSFDNHVRWSGTNSVINIVHDFFFNDDEERVNIKTTIEALVDITDLLFARAIDPDPDSRAHGTSATNNQRGIDNNGDGDALDSGDVAVENFVGSLGSVSGTPLGLFANTSFTQNTGIVGACCSVFDPLTYLAGGNLGDSSTGDNGIGIAFNLGDLLAGEQVSVDYAYVMAGSLATIDLPDDDDSTTVPTPSSIGLFGLCLLALTRRFKLRK